MNIVYQGFCITQGHEYPNDPAELIKSFFEKFPLSDIHAHLNELLVCALTESEVDFNDGNNRSDAIFFTEHAWYAFQAMLIFQKRLWPN